MDNRIFIMQEIAIQEAFSTPLEGSKKPGFSHIYRNSLSLNELVMTPVPGEFSLKKILVDLFLNKYSSRPYLGKEIVI